jgi:hypothetical protein
MSKPEPRTTVSFRLSEEQKAIVRGILGREGETLELRVEELEERIAPRLASNHNEAPLMPR